MRELKFRAWSKNDKIMGVPFDLFDELTDNSDSHTGWLKDTIFLQYTGKKDKNGVEIYEGDIVEIYAPLHTATTEQTRFRNAVTWNYEASGGGWSWVEEGVEVLGNIYENKELLR